MPGTRPPPALRRPPLWREVAVIGAIYLAYSVLRGVVESSHLTAVTNAMELYRLEAALHVNVEHTLNVVLARPDLGTLAVVANYSYAVPHFAVTLPLLIWLYLRHPACYRSARTIVVATTCIALVGFALFPLAPPRMLPGLGFVDTVVRDHTWGSWQTSTMTAMANQYAAMPSLHIAWALWCSGVVLHLAHRRWVRILAFAYPPYITLVIMATGQPLPAGCTRRGAGAGAGRRTRRGVARAAAATRRPARCHRCGVRRSRHRRLSRCTSGGCGRRRRCPRWATASARSRCRCSPPG